MLKKTLPDILIFLAIIILGIKLAFDSWMYTDIWLYDESMYLSKGVNFNPVQSYFRDGYVYFIWYKFLSLFAPDNIDLYFLNNAVLLVAPSVAMYVFLRVVKVNILISFLSSFIFLISASNVISWPFITKFALLVMLSGFSVIYLIKNKCKKLLAAILLAVLLTYIRPEFILTLLFLCMIYFVVIFREYGFVLSRRIIVSAIPIVTIVCLIVIFNPVTGKRANLAFVQHYVKDINERKGIYNIQGLADSDSIMIADFGGNVSMKDALIRNPWKIFAHMKHNFLRIDDHVSYIVPFTIVNDTGSIANKVLTVLAYAGAILSLLFLLKCIVRREFSLFRLIYFLFALPTFLSIIFYFPRTHYTILTIAFVLIFLSFEISKLVRNNFLFQKYSFASAVGAGLVIILFVPLKAGEELVHETSCSTFNVLKIIKKYQQPGSMNLLTAGSGIQNYLGDNWNYVSPEKVNGPVGKFVEDAKVNIILVNKFILAHPNIKGESVFEELLNKHSFKKIEIKNCDTYLIVRSDLVKYVE